MVLQHLSWFCIYRPFRVGIQLVSAYEFRICKNKIKWNNSPEFPSPLRLIITQIYMSARKYTSNKYENACNFVQRQTRAKTKKKQADESSYLVH